MALALARRRLPQPRLPQLLLRRRMALAREAMALALARRRLPQPRLPQARMARRRLPQARMARRRYIEQARMARRRLPQPRLPQARMALALARRRLRTVLARWRQHMPLAKE
ncbi:hypothetical protein GUJ93_ZPchr0003g17199 [Zizania palustris]|uniref:Uncharacterized protein n=1 Tax=Zizania palustris TaxID=103762 RepID=A0A8J5S8E6_ZIZPA|nr:hypothetical protein GUJ93_ZPchr0003g17199 [Zizania palustris]